MKRKFIIALNLIGMGILMNMELNKKSFTYRTFKSPLLDYVVAENGCRFALRSGNNP